MIIEDWLSLGALWLKDADRHNPMDTTTRDIRRVGRQHQLTVSVEAAQNLIQVLISCGVGIEALWLDIIIALEYKLRRRRLSYCI